MKFIFNLYFLYVAKPTDNANIQQDIEYHKKAKYFLDLANIKLMSKIIRQINCEIGCKYFEKSNSREFRKTTTVMGT